MPGLYLRGTGTARVKVLERLPPRLPSGLSAIGTADYPGDMPPDNAMHGEPHDLYAQAEAARKRSVLLTRQLRATERKAKENWQLIESAWNQNEQIRAQRRAARADPEWLQYSAYARLQARLASLPVIEQAKGIIMARYGWPEQQAFDALRRASQRENIKVRDLAASIVAWTVRSAPRRRPSGPAATTARSDHERGRRTVSGDSRDNHRASA